MPFIVGCTMPLAAFVGASAQTTAHSVVSVLEERIQPNAVTAYQLQSYLAKRIPSLSPPISSDKWSSEEARIRNHVLEDVAFHGWPREWIDAAPRFHETDVIESDKGTGCASCGMRLCRVLSLRQSCTNHKRSTKR